MLAVEVGCKPGAAEGAGIVVVVEVVGNSGPVEVVERFAADSFGEVVERFVDNFVAGILAVDSSEAEHSAVDKPVAVVHSVVAHSADSLAVAAGIPVEAVDNSELEAADNSAEPLEQGTSTFRPISAAQRPPRFSSLAAATAPMLPYRAACTHFAQQLLLALDFRFRREAEDPFFWPRSSCRCCSQLSRLPWCLCRFLGRWRRPRT